MEAQVHLKTVSLFVKQHGVALCKINRYSDRRENPKHRIVFIA